MLSQFAVARQPDLEQPGGTMSMTPDQILLVQTSFEMTGADGTALAR